MRLYPFFVTPSSPINALTSNLFRVRLGIKRIVTPHSTYLSHSLACPLCVPLRRFVYSHTCMSVDPVGKARSKSDYGLFSISFLISLDWDNKEETRKRSVYRLRVFPQNHIRYCLSTSGTYRTRYSFIVCLLCMCLCSCIQGVPLP